MGVPFSSGNQIIRLKNGEQIFPAMLAGIQRAKSRIDFITYVYWTGEIADNFAQALADKAQQGVEVRVLLDAFGSRPIVPRLLSLMKNAGVSVRWFRPLRSHRIWMLNKRTHRKVLVIDGVLGFTGGVGIAKEWQGDGASPENWRDSHFQLRGPAVRGLMGAFFANWSETGEILVDSVLSSPVNPTPGSASIQVIKSTTSAGWSDITSLLHLAIELAEKTIRISTAYFVPDQAMCDRLIATAKKGVEIDILIPGEHTDQRASQIAGEDQFEQLLQVGIRIWRFGPTMLHTKIILVDDYLSCVGSPNFNQRSMGKDDELVLVVVDANFNSQLSVDFASDLENSENTELRQWKKRSVLQRSLEFISRVYRKEV